MAKKLTLEDIGALFPIKVKVTKEMIDEANVNNIYNCIGAKALKAAIPNIAKNKRFEIIWGTSNGYVLLADSDKIVGLEIENKEGINLMRIKKPKTITLISNGVK
jgi:hypothetical protein